MKNRIILIVGIFLLSLQLGAQISQLPHLEDFESEFQCPVGCIPICNLKGSWKNVGGDNFDWSSDKAGTGTGGTGPSVDHTRGDKYGHYIYLETSCDQQGYPSKRVDLVSSYYDFTNIPGGRLRLAAWYHMYGANMGYLHFDVDTTRGQGNWINDFVTSWTDNQNLWQRKEINLDNFIGKDSVRFRFRGITGTYADSDMALDDILVYEPSDIDLGIMGIASQEFSCGLSNAEQVTVLISNYGLLGLNPGDTIPVSYQVNNQAPVEENFVLNVPFPVGGFQIFTFTTTTNMSAFQVYDITARTLHPQDGLQFNDEDRVSIRNHPIINQFPYDEDFENGDGGWLCDGTNNSWVLGDPGKTVINSPASGWNCWTTGWLNSQYPNGEYSWVQSPCFNFTGICRPEIRFSSIWENEFSWDGAVLAYSTNQGTNWYRLGNWNTPTNWYNDNTINARPGNQTQGWSGSVADSNGSGGWVISHNRMQFLSNKASVSFRIFFASDFSNRGEGFAFDDIQISNGVYLGRDISFCMPGSTTISVQNSIAGDNFLWSTGATTSSITVTSPGKYWVRVTNNSTCTTSDTIEVVGVNSSYAVSLGADTSVCGGLWLDGGSLPGAVYHWSNGDSVRNSLITSSGAYWVDVTTPCGIVRSDTIQVTVLAVAHVNLGSDSAVCGSYLLDAGNGGATYQWSTGDTGRYLLADTSGSYSVLVTAANGCQSVDTVDLAVNPVPQVDIGPADSAICFGETLCLAAGNTPGWTYHWSTGSTQATLCVAQNGKYFVAVTNPFSCTSRDTLTLTLQGAPEAHMIIDTSGCPIVNFIDNSSQGTPNAWLWRFGDGTTDTVQFPTHNYSAAGQGTYLVTLISSNDCGSDSIQDVVQINCSIGLNEIVEGGIHLYPNPNSGRFFLWFNEIDLQQGSLEIFDLNGRQIKSFPLNQVAKGEKREFQLKGITPGLYLARLNGVEKSFFWKIQVE
ncbi:MAG: T9SS type A sorting domain-containing protein [Bacteroidia bacterium]|nr:T9SS type A sorting domain-containing protein [Bacteroidia bacterium]